MSSIKKNYLSPLVVRKSNTWVYVYEDPLGGQTGPELEFQEMLGLGLCAKFHAFFYEPLFDLLWLTYSYIHGSLNGDQYIENTFDKSETSKLGHTDRQTRNLTDG